SMQLINILVIIVLCILLYIYMPGSIYIDITVVSIAIMCCIYVYVKEVNEVKYRINELSKSIDIVFKENLSKLDIPMIMVSNNLKVIWKNVLADDVLNNEYIDEVITAFDKIKKQGKELEYISKNDDTIYSAIGNYITFSNVNCTLIYFIDRTNETYLSNKLNAKTVASLVISIDNYDETLQGIDENIKAEITSNIDKLLRKFIEDRFGVLIKIDKDKYFAIIERQHITKLEEEKFNILEEIKEITTKTKLPITISMGISMEEEELNERFVSANSALDIALGRGGDQVVIKKNKKFDFYGGTNTVLEKTNRVRARTISGALIDIMSKCDNVYIVGHKNSDIDCIGSAIGIKKIADYLNKKSYILVDNKYSNTTKVILDKIKEDKDYEDVFISKEDIKKTDFTNSLLVVVDTHKKTYLAVNDLIDEFTNIVLIDHHRRGPEFIDNATLTYHEVYASSTCELVCELLMYINNIKLKSNEAECMYAGLLIDTKNFTFKTGVRTFEVAAYLKKFGLDISEIKQLFQNDFKTYLSKVEIVKNAEIINKQIAISICTEENDDITILAASAADELLSISGIIASFVICKNGNIVMISSRSMGDINVQLIMEKLGGGGHLTFAGAQLTDVTLEEAKQKLLDVIKEYIEK
ncbi:MAG: DHH family phosphoesterase, partial [Clostridia bacterium]